VKPNHESDPSEIEPEPRLITVFNERYGTYLEVSLEQIIGRMEARLPVVLREALRRDPSMGLEEAIKAGYAAGVTDAFRSLDGGEELIREALETVFAETN
jgi:hypothetical protein